MKRLLFVLLPLLCWFDGFAQDAIPMPGNRAEAFVAATPGYRFHSDFWMNLHHYLYGITGGGPFDRSGYAEENAACFAEQSSTSGWADAKDFYREHLGGHQHRGGALRAIRYQINTLGTAASTDSVVVAAFAHLQAAAPAYRACLWDTHDARNRAVVGELVTMLVQHARPLQDQLSNYYYDAWPQDLVVDLAAYTDFAGANTESGPGLADHMMLSSAKAAGQGFGGLETLLHEASHIMFGPRHGAIARSLQGASAELDIRSPRGLWHALSFHTSGWVVQRAAEANGIAYTPYWLEQGLFSDFVSPIEIHWQAYLDGTATMDEAITNLLRALAEE
ncbi:MAG: hypothetical protein RhofKO_06010 [Rhodothermales bacterium]